MKAVVFEHLGSPEEVLQLADVPAPVPHGDRVLVRVNARPIQPADGYFVRGQYRIKPQLPQVAGLEGAGVVVRDVRNLMPEGTRVAFRWPGTWAELALIPASRLIPVPEGITDAIACQISLNPVTAWAILDEVAVSAGDWLVVTAGGSTVSRLVAGIARRRGVHVIGLVRRSAIESEGRAAADLLLSTQDPELIEKISAAAGNGKVAGLLDSVGGPLTTKLFATLRAGARALLSAHRGRDFGEFSGLSAAEAVCRHAE